MPRHDLTIRDGQHRHIGTCSCGFVAYGGTRAFAEKIAAGHRRSPGVWDRKRQRPEPTPVPKPKPKREKLTTFAMLGDMWRDSYR